MYYPAGCMCLHCNVDVTCRMYESEHVAQCFAWMLLLHSLVVAMVVVYWNVSAGLAAM